MSETINKVLIFDLFYVICDPTEDKQIFDNKN